MLNSSKDNDLFSRIQESDHDAFNQLFLKFYKPLLLFSNFMVEDEEAKDLIADLFLDIWEMRESLSINSSVSAYLHTALKNKTINSRKSKDRNICIADAELHNIQAELFKSPARMRLA